MADPILACLLDIERAARDLLNHTGRGGNEEDLADARFNLREALFRLDDVRLCHNPEGSRLSEVLRTGT